MVSNPKISAQNLMSKNLIKQLSAAESDWGMFFNAFLVDYE